MKIDFSKLPFGCPGGPRWLPLLVGIAVLTVALAQWKNLVATEEAGIRSRIRLKSESAKNEVLAQLGPQALALIRMARRWEVRGNPDKAEWEADARIYIEHFPFYEAIEWADASAHVRWAISAKGEEAVRDRDPASDPARREAWEAAREKRVAAITRVVDLAHKGKGFCVYAPIFLDGEFGGAIVGVFQVEKLMDKILRDDVFQGVRVAVYDGDREIYRQSDGPESAGAMVEETVFEILGVPWRMRIWPKREWLDEQGSLTDEVELVMGSAMALTLAFATRLAQRARRRAVQAESVSRELEDQIGKRKLAEQALKESEERYRGIVDMVPDMIYRLDARGHIIYVSQGAAALGLKPGALIGRHFSEIVHPEDRGLANRRFNERRTGERATRHLEFRILNVVGETRECELVEIPIHLSATGIYSANATPSGGGGEDAVYLGTQGIVRDITGQKKARDALREINEKLEERVRQRTAALHAANLVLLSEIDDRARAQTALRESEERLRSILDNAPAIIYLKDPGGRYLNINRQFEKLFKWDPESVIGKTDHELFPAKFADLFTANDRKVLESRSAREYEETLLCENKLHSYISAKFPLLDANGVPYAVCGITTDITELKQLEAVAARFARILDNSFNEIYIFDSIALRFVHVNLGARKNLGYTMEELTRLTPLDLKPEFSRKKFEETLDPLRQRVKDAVYFETVHKRKDGSLYPVEVRLQLSFTEEPPLFLAVIQDVTDRRRTEEALRKSETELAHAQRIAQLGNWVWDIKSDELRWSDEIYRIFGLMPQEFGVTHQAFLERVHPDDRAFVVKSVEEALYERKPYSIDHRVILPDGHIRVVHGQSMVVYDEEGRPSKMMGTIQNITDRHLAATEISKSREQLRNLCAHLESVREEERTRIAREVHDELGQVLTALKIDLAWARRRLPAGETSILDKIKSMYALVETTIGAVQRITAELRPQILDVLGLFEAVEWQAREFQKRTGIRCEIDVEKKCVDVDQKRSTTFFRILQEALTNVARHSGAAKVRVVLREREKSLVLEVSDDGRGISPERISDPKSFGLMGIRERALLWAGKADFHSSPGKGTTVSITIPLQNHEETKER